MDISVIYGVTLVLLGSTFLCSAGPRIIGEPPSFVTQPEDTVVYSSYFREISDTVANLVLNCGVTGSPAPTVSWFRGDTDITSQGLLLSNGTIGLNITESADIAARAGVPYHCTATNIIGLENATATIRSRDANVTYAFFDGFDGMNSTTVQFAEGQTGALECSIRPSNPPPVVRWRHNGVLIELDSRVRVVEDRFLFFTMVRSSDGGTYECEVTNALISNVERSHTRYIVSVNLPTDMVKTYKEIGNLVGQVGQRKEVFYAAAFISSQGSVFNGVPLTCNPPPSITFDPTTRIGSFVVPSPVGQDGDTVISVSCLARPDSGSFLLNFTLTIEEPANITNIGLQSPDLVQRGLIAGGPPVVLTCTGSGIPQPSVKWFYNGSPISSSDGVSENGNQLTISSPQTTNSGIYQCFVSNVIEGSQTNMQRSWIIEITTPSLPTIEPLVLTNPLAVSDRLVGSVIVQPFNTTDEVVLVTVYSNPCPNVQWQFNGINIASSNNMYTFNDPCADESNFSPYTFKFTIANLTETTSGNYSALFNNTFTEVVRLPGLYVTNPVPVVVESISLEILNAPGARCLLAGSTAVLTCNIQGFPRPTIQFAKESVTVMPASSERISNISFDQIELIQIDRNDEGLYSCQANRVQLINPPTFQYCTVPVIMMVTSSSNIVEGNPFEVECDFESTPFPGAGMVTWLKDNQPLSGEGDNIRISTSMMVNNVGKAIVSVTSSTISNNGVYTCVIANPAMTVNGSVQVQVQRRDTALLSTSAIIGVAAGAAGLVLIIVLLVLLLICVFLCARKSSKSVDFHPYNVDTGEEYKDGRGNVDADSVDGNVPPEAFDPDYASLPTTRPHDPPPYKAAPGYGHGGPLEGDDLEMVKYPPQDSESFVAGYSRQQDQYRPTPDDFLSEDAQFV